MSPEYTDQDLWVGLGEDVDLAVAEWDERDTFGRNAADCLVEQIIPASAKMPYANDLRNALKAMVQTSLNLRREREGDEEDERLHQLELEQDEADMEATYKTLGPEI